MSEYLLANLLAPVGGGILSAALSQQEYSKLFESDRLGLFSETTYLSRGAWNQIGGVFGTFGNTSFLTEAFYAQDPGQVANNDLEQRALSLQFKQQTGPRDTFYVQALLSDLDSGDLRRQFDPRLTDPDLRVRERLEPVLVSGWHRRWSAQSDTLLLASFVQASQKVQDPTRPVQALETDLLSGHSTLSLPFHIAEDYRSDAEVFSLEGQQIWHNDSHTALGGFRYQHGEFSAEFDHGPNDGYNPLVLPPGSGRVSPGLERMQVYAYETWRLLPALYLNAGLSFDHLRYPRNFRFAPLTAGEETENQLSPKAGLIWDIAPRIRLRAGYTRSLGGASFEQSFRLEPTQVAGFNQTFRSLAPESVTGPSTAANFETIHLALETRISSNTWFSVTGERLASQMERTLGFYAGDPNLALASSSVREDLDYVEEAVTLNLNHLLGDDWALGVRYRLSHSTLEQSLPDVPSRFEDSAWLNDLRLTARFNHPSGWFAVTETVWLEQENDGNRADEDVWHFNVMAGYRFAQRRAELAAGVMNLTDRDHRLNPVSLYSTVERERTLFARLRWSF